MRRFRPALACLLLIGLLTGCTTLGAASAWLRGEVSFSEGQLQQRLDRRFPRDFDKLGGVVTLTLANPRVTIPQADTRLRLEFDLGIGALGSRGEPDGHLAIASGLRYDPTTQGLHLDQPEVLALEIPGAGALLRGGARGLTNTLLAEYARTEPVYRLDDDLIAKLPRGRQIGNVAVENGRVVVRLVR